MSGHFWKLSFAKIAPRLRARAICTKKRHHAACSEHFWKLISTKFAPRLRARAIWKSKSLKTDGLGTFFEVESVFRVARARIYTRCKIRGRRRSSWGLQKRWQAWWIWRGSETMRFAWQAQWFRALWCRCLKPWTLKPWKGCKFHVTEALLCSDHFAWQLQDFVCLGSTFSWQAQYFWSVQLKIVKKVLEFCGQVSGQVVIFEGSLAEKLRFWASKLYFWRKSRRKALFLSFKDSFLKEVSQKCFVFELQSFIFEGSLAEMLGFWSSKLHFWRKSRRNASFLIFKDSFLKEVSQKCFVFDLQSFVFEGSLAEKLRFSSRKLSFWRKCRKKLRFWVAKLHFWRKSRRQASFLSFKASFFKEVSQKCLVFDLQSLIFEGSLKFNWRPTHLNLKSIDNQITSISDQLQCRITWISNQLTATSFEVQINRQPKSFEAHIDWQPNHLNLNSFEADINWLSNHLHSAHPFPIGSLSLETSATALCGRYVNIKTYRHVFIWISKLCCLHTSQVVTSLLPTWGASFSNLENRWDGKAMRMDWDVSSRSC